MKKILLLFVLLPFMCFGQIGPIQTNGEKYKRVGKYMLNYANTNRYVLLLQNSSDEVRINLGIGPTEAAKSLAYLYEVIFEEGKTFTLQGRMYDVNTQKICVHDAYAIDGICISESELKSEILTLIMEQGAEYGEMFITQGSASIGNYMVIFDTYGIVDAFYFGHDVSGSLSRIYNNFEKLSVDDVRILRDLIRDNYTSVTNALLGLTACDVILESVTNR